MSSPRPNNKPKPKTTTQPIPIATSGRGRERARPRSMSMSSSSESTGSPSSPTTPPPMSPMSKINIPSPATSPILSYFLAQSPTKTPGSSSFPFRKFGGPAPVFEEEERDIKEVSATHHARRASTAVAERLAQPVNPQLPDAHHERGQGVMRRLSLSGAFMTPRVPNPPPNTAVSPTQSSLPFSRDRDRDRDPPPRRSATISSPPPRRAPSPMGERILKGHFDGFN